ncbi:MAG TPA: hypothetical protein VFO77_15380 [Actinoplanes sp.]|nr:hypothetical protein [Actinoplanes sp.]
MNNATLHGGRLFSSELLGMFVVAGIALLIIFSYAPGGTPATVPASAVLASVGLVDDDAQQGLFDVSGLVPGRATTRCISVQYGGPAPAGTVYFAAADVTGGLAGNLRLRVEQGTGGGFNSCNGFSGSVIYDGTLAGLVDPDPANPRTSTGWSPAATDARTYRLTATMNDSAAAQNQHSTATFQWFLVGTPEPTQTATPSPTAEPVPTETVGTVTDPTQQPEPAVSATSSSSAAPAPAASATPSVSAAPSVSATVVPSDEPVLEVSEVAEETGPVAAVRRALADLGRKLAEVGRDLSKVAKSSVTHSYLPTTGIAVLIAFLAVQNRIDRMDPKLALAPTQDPHLVFREPDKDLDSELDSVLRPDEAVP